MYLFLSHCKNQLKFICASLIFHNHDHLFFKAYLFPYWSSFLLPMVQIALMSSVYCTVVMSWERYVRICLVAKLGGNYFSTGRFNLYIAFIVIFPILFYIPKFFEVSALILTVTYIFSYCSRIY